MTSHVCECGLAIHSGTKHMHRPHCPLDTRTLEDRIAQAIGDPGSILPRNSQQTYISESGTRWATRAVMRIIDAETTLQRGLMFLDSAPGGDHLPDGRTLRCQTRAINADGVTFRCASSAWHPERPCDFVAE